jgi:hypothetical protein
VELQRIIGAQADLQPNVEKFWKWVPLVRQEQSIVAQGAHGDTDLL